MTLSAFVCCKWKCRLFSGRDFSIFGDLNLHSSLTWSFFQIAEICRIRRVNSLFQALSEKALHLLTVFDYVLPRESNTTEILKVLAKCCPNLRKFRFEHSCQSEWVCLSQIVVDSSKSLLFSESKSSPLRVAKVRQINPTTLLDVGTFLSQSPCGHC